MGLLALSHILSSIRRCRAWRPRAI